MPIFFQQDIDADTRLGIWKIEEDENFFLEKVMPQRNVSHPHKKLQHLAGRYLLNYLFPDFPVSLIQIADTRKPFLQDEAYHFSISHCGAYAAAIVSKVKRVGVDIELITPKVERIQHKFLSQNELDNAEVWLVTKSELLTMLWSCKEAVFKWYGLGEVDFKEHIQVKELQIGDAFSQTTILFTKDKPITINLESRFFSNELCLSYVVT
jgi:phosphopantetheinyl transferase